MGAWGCGAAAPIGNMYVVDCAANLSACGAAGAVGQGGEHGDRRGSIVSCNSVEFFNSAQSRRERMDASRQAG